MFVLSTKRAGASSLVADSFELCTALLRVFMDGVNAYTLECVARITVIAVRNLMMDERVDCNARSNVCLSVMSFQQNKCVLEKKEKNEQQTPAKKEEGER